jgi:hypothetical protein
MSPKNWRNKFLPSPVPVHGVVVWDEGDTGFFVRWGCEKVRFNEGDILGAKSRDGGTNEGGDSGHGAFGNWVHGGELEVRGSVREPAVFGVELLFVNVLAQSILLFIIGIDRVGLTFPMSEYKTLNPSGFSFIICSLINLNIS